MIRHPQQQQRNLMDDSRAGFLKNFVTPLERKNVTKWLFRISKDVFKDVTDDMNRYSKILFIIENKCFNSSNNKKDYCKSIIAQLQKIKEKIRDHDQHVNNQNNIVCDQNSVFLSGINVNNFPVNNDYANNSENPLVNKIRSMKQYLKPLKDIFHIFINSSKNEEYLSPNFKETLLLASQKINAMIKIIDINTVEELNNRFSIFQGQPSKIVFTINLLDKIILNLISLFSDHLAINFNRNDLGDVSLGNDRLGLLFSKSKFLSKLLQKIYNNFNKNHSNNIDTEDFDDSTEIKTTSSSSEFIQTAQLNHDKVISKIFQSFKCPITLEIMSDPVIASDGHTYERRAIEQWFQTKIVNKHEILSPLTSLPLENTNLIPNFNLKSQITEFCSI